MKRLAITLLVLFTLSACVGDLPYEPPQDPPGPSPGNPQVSVEYADGAWNYAIEVDVPTPCHGVDVDGIVAESYPEQISLTLTITEPSGNEACPQVVDRASVEGSITASEYASMTITFEGKQIYQHNARTPPDLMPPIPKHGPEVEVEYADGAWNYAIEVDVPTPCHGLDVDGSVAESYPEQISLTLTVTEPSADEMCPQVVDRASVEGSVDASEYASMTITFEGKQIYQHGARTPPGLTPPDDRFCTDVYAPVCGQPPMPPCPEGFGCIDVMPQPRTYDNDCELERDRATLLYDGVCRDNLVVS